MRRAKNTSKCNYQVTKSVRDEKCLQFAIEQLKKHGKPWEVKRLRNGMVSVWTHFDCDEKAATV